MISYDFDPFRDFGRGGKIFVKFFPNETLVVCSHAGMPIVV